MRVKLFSIVIALALAGIAAGGYLYYRQHRLRTGDPARKTVPVAADREARSRAAPGCISRVETASIRLGTISEELLEYGRVIPAPGARRIVSVPFESHVVDVFVNAGQKVSSGDRLLEIEPSPATALQFEQASNSFRLVRQEVQQVERKFNLKLATNEQLLRAKQRLEAARTKLENLKKQGIGGKKIFRARIGGLIKGVDVQQGNVVPAGGPLIEIVAEGHMQILLGVEPEDIERVRPGQQVFLTRVNVPSAPVVTGRVERLSYQIDPTTGLDDVFVTIPSPAGLILGEMVLGRIKTGAVSGLIVPRSAVLSKGGRSFVYVVRNGVARKYYVRIDFENAEEYIISSRGLSAGDRVVSLGNYELKDGMAVESLGDDGALRPPAGGGSTPGRSEMRRAFRPISGYSVPPLADITGGRAAEAFR